MFNFIQKVLINNNDTTCRLGILQICVTLSKATVVYSSLRSWFPPASWKYLTKNSSWIYPIPLMVFGQLYFCLQKVVRVLKEQGSRFQQTTILCYCIAVKILSCSVYKPLHVQLPWHLTNCWRWFLFPHSTNPWLHEGIYMLSGASCYDKKYFKLFSISKTFDNDAMGSPHCQNTVLLSVNLVNNE